MFTNIVSNQSKTVIRRALKRFLTGYYTIFLTFLLLSNIFLITSHLITTPVNAQSQTQFFELDFNNISSTSGRFRVANGIYVHRTDQLTIDTFTDGKSGLKMTIPIPQVSRNEIDDPSFKTVNRKYLDDPYPDGIFVSPSAAGLTITSGSAADLSKYKKKCDANESSIVYFVPLSTILEINKNLYSNSNSIFDSTKSAPDPKTGAKTLTYTFKSKNLSSLPITNVIAMEYCYTTLIKGENIGAPQMTLGYGTTQTVEYGNPKKQFSRTILGGVDNALVNQVLPKELTNSSNKFTSIGGIQNGTVLNDSQFEKISSTGVGEFTTTISADPIVCPLTQNVKALSTDLYGNQIKGVNTALGCLPGSFEGIFAVILRITIGMSSAILLLLLIGNGLTIVQSNNSPDKIKVAVSNITRGIAALLIIIFSVFILNLFGIKILALDSLGDVGIQQTLGN